MKEIVSKINVQSYMASSSCWKIAKYDDGSFSCNCPAWIYHRGHKVDCKHILEWKRQAGYQNLTIQGINAKSEKNEAHNSVIGKENDVVNDLLFGKMGVLK